MSAAIDAANMTTVVAQPTIRKYRGIINLSMTRRLEARCMRVRDMKVRIWWVPFFRRDNRAYIIRSVKEANPYAITRRAGQHWYRKHAGTDNAAGE